MISIQRIFLLSIILIFTRQKQLYMSEVYRHGASYSTHDFYDYNQTKQFSGQVTSVGLRQHYLLGSYIQNQYIKSKTPLLNATLKPRQTEFFTLVTDTGRCEESAYAQTLGMFPYGYGQTIPLNIDPKLLEPPFQTIFPSNLKSETAPQKIQIDQFALEKGFQPVPIRYGNFIFPQCPNINVILSRRGQLIAKDVATFQAQQSAFTEKMRLVFNLTVSQSNVAGLQDLAETLISDKWLNRDFPATFTESDFNQIYYIRSFLLTNLYAGEVPKIVNGPFINQLIQNMELKIKDKLGEKKYSSISAQDLNVIPLLTYYNLTSSDCIRKKFKNQTVTQNCVDSIPFAQNLVFELHQNDSNPEAYFVKTRFNGVYYKLFGKNTTEIEFNQFAAKSKADLMNFNTECKVKVIVEKLE